MQIENEHIDLKGLLEKAYRRVHKAKTTPSEIINPVVANCFARIDDSALLTAIIQYHNDFHSKDLRKKDKQLTEVTWVTFNLLQFFINRALQQYFFLEQPGADSDAIKKTLASLTDTMTFVFNSLSDRLIVRHLKNLTLINKLAAYPEIAIPLGKIDTLYWNRLGLLPFAADHPLRVSDGFVLSDDEKKLLDMGDLIIKDKNFSGLNVDFIMCNELHKGATFLNCNFYSSFTTPIYLHFVTFSKCDLRRSRLLAALVDVTYHACNLEGADLSFANLQNINNDFCSNTIHITDCITKDVIYNIDKTDEKFRKMFTSSGHDLGFSSNSPGSESLTNLKTYLTFSRDKFFSMYYADHKLNPGSGIESYISNVAMNQYPLSRLADENKIIQGINFSGLKIVLSSEFNGITFMDCQFDDAVIIVDSSLTDLNFEQCSCQYAVFTYISCDKDGQEPLLTKISMIDCDLYKVKALGFTFENATLVRTNLDRAVIYNTSFCNATLKNVNFNDATVEFPQFSGAKATNCSFTNCAIKDRKKGGLDIDHIIFDLMPSFQLLGIKADIQELIANRQHLPDQKLPTQVIAYCIRYGIDLQGYALSKNTPNELKKMNYKAERSNNKRIDFKNTLHNAEIDNDSLDALRKNTHFKTKLGLRKISFSEPLIAQLRSDQSQSSNAKRKKPDTECVLNLSNMKVNATDFSQIAIEKIDISGTKFTNCEFPKGHHDLDITNPAEKNKKICIRPQTEFFATKKDQQNSYLSNSASDSNDHSPTQ